MAKPELRNHLKFLKLLEKFKGNEAAALGHLEFIWMSCADRTSDVFDDKADLERAARWHGKPGKLTEILKECGFLDRLKGPRIRVHNYFLHCPRYIAKRVNAPHVEADTDGDERTPTESNGRPYRSRSRSRSLPQKITPRSGPHPAPKNRDRRVSRLGEAEEARKPPMEAPHGALADFRSMIPGVGSPSTPQGPPGATVPIGAYSLADCVSAVAAHDHRKPFPEAHKMWYPRLAEVAIYPEGLDFMRDLLTNIAAGNVPGGRKGIGKIHNAAAFINDRTRAFIEARQKGKAQ